MGLWGLPFRGQDTFLGKTNPGMCWVLCLEERELGLHVLCDYQGFGYSFLGDRSLVSTEHGGRGLISYKWQCLEHNNRQFSQLVQVSSIGLIQVLIFSLFMTTESLTVINGSFITYLWFNKYRLL